MINRRSDRFEENDDPGQSIIVMCSGTGELPLYLGKRRG
jgi:hypothetical protein